MEQLLLKDICTFANGKAHEQYVDENGEYILVTSKFIASDGESYRRTSDRLTPLEVGDLCMVMSDVPKGRALAKCFLVDKNDIYTLNQRIGVFKADDRYLKKYFYYMLNRNRYFLSFDDGDSQTNLRKDDILNCPVICPSKEEQLEVIKILDGVALIIRQREEQLKYLDDLIKARFVELFGNGHDGVCNTKNLGGFCKFQQGTQVPVEEQIEEKLDGYTRFLRIIDYTQAPQPPRYVSVKGREIESDSVVIVRYGATAGFVGHGYAGILANNLFEVVPNEKVLSKDFLYLALKYGTFEQEVHDKAFGAAMPALSFGMMNDIGVVTPDSVAQSNFVDFVKQVDKSKFV